MDGLIHISELSWSHVNHPSEILEIGQTVQVKVLDIDRERQRISLGLKQTQSDPWQQVLEHYHEEDVVEGRVTKVVTFGAFVEILPGVEGLVHISELAQHHVENPREVVSQGDPVNVLILEIDGDRRRLSLSLKRVEEGAEPLPRADGGESVHLTPNLRLSEEAFPAGSESEGDPAGEPNPEAVELAEAALALDADAQELAVDAVVAEEIAVELAEEAVVAEEIAVELAEEAIVADAVAEELAVEALEADAAGDTEAAVELAEEAVAVEELAVELAEEAVVADAAAVELAEEAIVADAVAVELGRRGSRRGNRCRRARRGSGCPRRRRPGRLSDSADASPRPIAVAITGGIGAGKSTVLAAFRAHGAATVSSDEIVHHLLRADLDVRRRSSSGSATGSSTRTAFPIARRSRRSSSTTPMRSRFSKRCCIRSSPASI